MRNVWFFGSIVIVVAAAWAVVAAADAAGDLLKDVVEVQLIREGPRAGAQKATIRDEAIVKKFVALTKLKAKDPCLCDCINSIILVRADGTKITLEISDHCVNTGGKCYEMPEGLWELYEKQLVAAGAVPAASGPAASGPTSRSANGMVWVTNIAAQRANAILDGIEGFRLEIQSYGSSQKALISVDLCVGDPLLQRSPGWRQATLKQESAAKIVAVLKESELLKDAQEVVGRKFTAPEGDAYQLRVFWKGGQTLVVDLPLSEKTLRRMQQIKDATAGDEAPSKAMNDLVEALRTRLQAPTTASVPAKP